MPSPPLRRRPQPDFHATRTLTAYSRRSRVAARAALALPYEQSARTSMRESARGAQSSTADRARTSRSSAPRARTRRRRACGHAASTAPARSSKPAGSATLEPITSDASPRCRCCMRVAYVRLCVGFLCMACHGAVVGGGVPEGRTLLSSRQPRDGVPIRKARATASSNPSFCAPRDLNIASFPAHLAQATCGACTAARAAQTPICWRSTSTISC
jgi:hypothetical protein